MSLIPNGVLINFPWMVVNGLLNQMPVKGCFFSEALFKEPHCFVPFCCLYLQVWCFVKLHVLEYA